MSKGETALSLDTWQHVKELEAIRWGRQDAARPTP
jgi:hypothetical protein